jgi:long-subunit acyl-CoA synthetase (AMP-forming)
MKVVFSGADSLRENTSSDWQERSGSTITNTYGMTEATAGTHASPKGKEQHGSVGVPISKS